MIRGRSSRPPVRRDGPKAWDAPSLSHKHTPCHPLSHSLVKFALIAPRNGILVPDKADIWGQGGCGWGEGGNDKEQGGCGVQVWGPRDKG